MTKRTKKSIKSCLKITKRNTHKNHCKVQVQNHTDFAVVWNKGECSNSDIVRIIKSVEILTRLKDETYSEYINRIAKSGDIDAIKVKLFDLMDHFAQEETLTDSLEKGTLKCLKL